MSTAAKCVWTMLIALTLLITTWAATAAGSPGPQPERGRPARLAATGPAEASYVSVLPCRSADTRNGGGLIAGGTVRSFRIRGTASLAGQGGPGTGCGVPGGASAITANVTVTGQTGSGYLIGYAADTAAPYTNFVSYSASSTVTVNPILPLAAVGIEPSLSIKNSGRPVHVIIDITGYYIPAIQAQLNADATIYAGTARVLSVTHPGVGDYRITVDTDVNDCAVTATTFDGGVVATGFSNGSTVVIRTRNSNNTLTDYRFNFTVTC